MGGAYTCVDAFGHWMSTCCGKRACFRQLDNARPNVHGFMPLHPLPLPFALQPAITQEIAASSSVEASSSFTQARLQPVLKLQEVPVKQPHHMYHTACIAADSTLKFHACRWHTVSCRVFCAACIFLAPLYAPTILLRANVTAGIDSLGSVLDLGQGGAAPAKAALRPGS